MPHSVKISIVMWQIKLEENNYSTQIQQFQPYVAKLNIFHRLIYEALIPFSAHIKSYVFKVQSIVQSPSIDIKAIMPCFQCTIHLLTVQSFLVAILISVF